MAMGEQGRMQVLATGGSSPHQKIQILFNISIINFLSPHD
jgi:hypothetical protein